MNVSLLITCDCCGTRAQTRPTGPEVAESVLEHALVLIRLLETASGCPSCALELAEAPGIDLSSWQAMVQRARPRVVS